MSRVGAPRSGPSPAASSRLGRRRVAGRLLLAAAGLSAILAAEAAQAQLKKEGVSYKALLADGGRVVGMRTGSIIIRRGDVLYNCPLATIRKSMIRRCKELKAEGEDRN